VIHVHAHTTPLEKQFAELRKQVSDPKKQKSIHRSAGNVIKKEMTSRIQDAREVVRIRRGPDSDPLDIPIGTLRRSIRVWLIDKQQTSYWVGPRVGRRMPVDRDGWFANIVEGGDQKFGQGRNKGVFYDSITTAAPRAYELMKRKYQNQINKAAKAKATRS